MLGLICALQIDKLNLEGYANLEHWVSELDKRIEGILLQRLRQIIDVWCTEFDRSDDGDDGGVAGKRRGVVGAIGGDKRAKDEKVRARAITHSSRPLI